MVQGQLDDIAAMESLLGRAGSPIPRLGRTQRSKVRVWIASEPARQSLPPDVLLRAILAAGQPIERALLEPAILANSLGMNDLLQYAPRLSVFEAKVDSTAVLHGIEDGLRKSPTPISMKVARSICSKLHRWRRWLASKRAVPSDQTAARLLQLLAVLLKRIVRPKGKGEKTQEKIGSLAISILSLAFLPSSESPDPALLLDTLRLLEAARQFAGDERFEDLLKDPRRQWWLNSCLEILPEAIKSLAIEGRIRELDEVAATCESFPAMSEQIRNVTSNLWRTKAGLLTESVQRWLQAFLGISDKGRVGTIQLVDQSEKPEIAQLGLALLRAWDARHEGRAAMQAFETLHQVCRNFYGIRLSGEVGERFEYDPRFHEPDGEIRRTRKVILRRPWVEWREGERWRVIIRGVVGPSESLGG